MTLKEKEHLEREAELVFNPRRKLRRSVYLLPSVFTVGTIFAGFYAIISTLNGQFESAAVAIGIAVVLDGLDGRVARLANATSDFGLQLDSLADVISFGIAPAILIYSWGLGEFGKFARFSTFVFLICGAMRLARFNVQLKDLKHFAGLPIPAGAGFVAATVHLFGEPPDSLFFKFYLVGITYLISFLMLSTIRYPSLKQLNLGRGKSHLNVLMLALLVAGVIWYSQQVLMVIATVYLCSGLFARVYQFVKYRIRSQGLPTKELNID
ncbi:CDP-diacylglycerol--serine O-phosphatidyltransferase [Acidobacteria bacterium AH-259-A15]|nr:CDP-diacylglycerol--serine O-phosphatidyltransferase [Acidobacteria bacterium AH-259-A15]